MLYAIHNVHTACPCTHPSHPCGQSFMLSRSSHPFVRPARVIRLCRSFPYIRPCTSHSGPVAHDARNASHMHPPPHPCSQSFMLRRSSHPFVRPARAIRLCRSFQYFRPCTAELAFSHAARPPCSYNYPSTVLILNYLIFTDMLKSGVDWSYFLRPPVHA